MLVQIRYFASVREIVGVSQETHDLPEAVLTVGQARDWLRAQGGRYALALAAEKVAYCKNAAGSPSYKSNTIESNKIFFIII